MLIPIDQVSKRIEVVLTSSITVPHTTVKATNFQVHVAGTSQTPGY